MSYTAEQKERLCMLYCSCAIGRLSAASCNMIVYGHQQWLGVMRNRHSADVVLSHSVLVDLHRMYSKHA